MSVSVHGGNLWVVSRTRGIPAERILDFSAAFNPWPVQVPSAFREEAWRQARHYPDPSYAQFRQAAAGWEGVDPEAILPGSGTADLIHLISRGRKGARCWIPVPTFTEYARAVEADGGRVSSWRLPEREDFSGAAFPQSLRNTKVDLVFLCNPNNPTGKIWPRETVQDLLELCERQGALLVLDEAYMDLAAPGRRYSLAGDASRNRLLLVLRSMTKSFGIPGLRLG